MKKGAIDYGKPGVLACDPTPTRIPVSPKRKLNEGIVRLIDWIDTEFQLVWLFFQLRKSTIPEIQAIIAEK